MHKVLIKLLCNCIPSNRFRRHVHSRLTEHNPALERQCLTAFSEAAVPEKCVLLVEPSITHGEVAPGLAKYWLDLGYHVHALLHDTVATEDPFCRFTHERLRIFRHTYGCYAELLSSPAARRYEAVFFTTPAYARWTKGGKRHALHDYPTALFRNGRNVFLVEHQLENIAPYAEGDILRQGRLVTLTELAWEGKPTLMLNPHFFGDIAVTPKNDCVNFITIGMTDKKRKNHNLLPVAANALLEKGVENFHITVLGAGRAGRAELEKSLPSHLRRHFTILGRVDFPQLYARMEEADFFLPLLDPDYESHNRYRTIGVSGSYQLILGFGKPCLIHKEFAPFHKFTEENSLLYESLEEAMARAVSLPGKDYARMQKELGRLSAELYGKSLKNLAEAVRSPEARRESAAKVAA